MKKGGYQIIDFNNETLSLENQIYINGIYKTIKDSNRKPLLLSNLIISGYSNNMFVIQVKEQDNKYIIPLEDVIITIQNNDIVSLTEKQSSGGKLYEHNLNVTCINKVNDDDRGGITLRILSSKSDELDINTNYAKTMIIKASGTKLTNDGLEIIKIGNFYVDATMGDVGLESYVDSKNFYFASSTYNITFTDTVTEL